jgi:phage shock protein C
MDQSKRLYRSRKERMIGGVCGGIGEYFNIDPTLVRLLFVVFALTGGSGVLAYLVFLIVVPEEPFDAPQSPPEVQTPESPEE